MIRKSRKRRTKKKKNDRQGEKGLTDWQMGKRRQTNANLKTRNWRRLKIVLNATLRYKKNNKKIQMEWQMEHDFWLYQACLEIDVRISISYHFEDNYVLDSICFFVGMVVLLFCNLPKINRHLILWENDFIALIKRNVFLRA